MNLLLPCAGKSTRYSTRVPKYLLTMPNNNIMVAEAAKNLLRYADKVVAGVLDEHDGEFGASSILKEAIPGCEVVIIKKVLNGPAATVANMIQKSGLVGPMLVRDCDSLWELSEQPYIGEWLAVVRDRSRFAIIANHEIVEKPMHELAAGGYAFSDVDRFMEGLWWARRYGNTGEVYMSDTYMGIPATISVDGYVPLATEQDWLDYRARFKTYIFDIDGVIYGNSGRWVRPRWGSTSAFRAVINRINELYSSGQTIILMTSRPEYMRYETECMLAADNVHHHQLVMGVNHGQRVIVNDYASSNPYPSAVAVNIKRDSGELPEGI